MPGRFLVRRFRASDLDRILTIEHASFGEDAYDRNLFAEYARECGALFLPSIDLLKDCLSGAKTHIGFSL